LTTEYGRRMRKAPRHATEKDLKRLERSDARVRISEGIVAGLVANVLWLLIEKLFSFDLLDFASQVINAL